MTTSPAKDFGPILDDYAFFERHATEAGRDAAAYAGEIAPLAARAEPLRMLDFGCGTGTFTQRLLDLLQLPPQRLELALVEPVATSHAAAAQLLKGYSVQPIRHESSLTAMGSGPFDLVVANHVLYYVPNLRQTLSDLLARLAPGGLLLTAIAAHDNPLIRFWRQGFALVGRPIPYYTAEDVAAAFQSLGVRCQQNDVSYELVFPDSRENRLKIQRFLFADHFGELPVDRLLELFDPYAVSGQIVIQTKCRHFTARR